MLNFEIKKSARKCYEDQQEFSPGEVFHSALIELQDGATERRDFCLEHWQEPAEDCIGWWRAQVPEAGKGKVYWAPRKVLLSYFEHLLGNKSTQDLAFVTGLLLVQKKILVLHDDGEDPNIMKLRNRLEKSEYRVPTFAIEGQRLAEIQNELAENLFMDEPIDDFEESEAPVE